MGSWWRFELRITVIFVITSLAGLTAMGAMLAMLGKFQLQEITVGGPAALPILGLVGGIQFLMNHYWLKASREWYLQGRNKGQRNAVYAELLRFPWRASLLSLGLWFLSLVLYTGTRLLLFESVPLYRHAVVALAIASSACAAWTLQYFLFRRTTFAMLERLDVSHEFLQTLPRMRITHKYTTLFGMLWIGAVLFAATIAYGLTRNNVLEDQYSKTRDLFLTAESLLYKHQIDDALDIQDKLDVVNARIRGTFDVVASPPADAVNVDRWFTSPQQLMGISYYRNEHQVLPEILHAYRRVSGDLKNVYLTYERSMRDVRSRLNTILLRTIGAAVLMMILLTTAMYGFMLDLMRPIHKIAARMEQNSVTLSTPPFVLTDDDLLGFSAGVRVMFLRLRTTLGELLQSFWSIKDRRQRIQGIAANFAHRTQLDGREIGVVTRRLRDMAEQIQELQQKLDAIADVGRSVEQALRLMSETALGARTKVLDIDGQLRRVRQWTRSTGEELRAANRALGDLDRWLTEAGHDYDRLQRRFLEFDTRLGVHEKQLSLLDRQLREGEEHGEAVTGLLASERDHYHEGIALVDGAQKRLDEVMERFNEVEAIREQIDMLSFQAAVVASQSLEYERDFRVVSDEIRDLSERAHAGIHRIFSAIWRLEQQGKQSLQRLLSSQYALAETQELSNKARTEADKTSTMANEFIDRVSSLLAKVRDEQDRTAALVEQLRGPLQSGTRLEDHLARLQTLYQHVESQLSRFQDKAEHVGVQLGDQIEGIRAGSSAMDRIGIRLREMISSSEGTVMQSRTLRSLLERLVNEADRSGRRIQSAIEDLEKIEQELAGSEAQVKQISSELKAAGRRT